MTCASIARDLMDVARGADPPASRTAAIDRHVRDCPDCSARLADERALSAAMRRLAGDTHAAAIDPDRESAIMHAFDAAWERPQSRNVSRVAVGAVLLAIAATVGWAVVRVPTLPPLQPHSPSSVARDTAPSPSMRAPAAVERVVSATPAPVARRRLASRTPAPIADTAPEPMPFHLWPGSEDLPTFESGHLMRMQLPASMLVSIGLTPPSRADVVQADVVVDQEGYARAVRLVP